MNIFHLTIHCIPKMSFLVRFPQSIRSIKARSRSINHLNTTYLQSLHFSLTKITKVGGIAATDVIIASLFIIVFQLQSVTGSSETCTLISNVYVKSIFLFPASLQWASPYTQTHLPCHCSFTQFEKNIWSLEFSALWATKESRRGGGETLMLSETLSLHRVCQASYTPELCNTKADELLFCSLPPHV